MAIFESLGVLASAARDGTVTDTELDNAKVDSAALAVIAQSDASQLADVMAALEKPARHLSDKELQICNEISQKANNFDQNAKNLLWTTDSFNGAAIIPVMVNYLKNNHGCFARFGKLHSTFAANYDRASAFAKSSTEGTNDASGLMLTKSQMPTPMVQEMNRHSATLVMGQSAGSAVCVSTDGVFVTAAHVIEGLLTSKNSLGLNAPITVYYQNSGEITFQPDQVRVLGFEFNEDIAVLQFPPISNTTFEPATLPSTPPFADNMLVAAGLYVQPDTLIATNTYYLLKFLGKMENPAIMNTTHSISFTISDHPKATNPDTFPHLFAATAGYVSPGSSGGAIYGTDISGHKLVLQGVASSITTSNRPDLMLYVDLSPNTPARRFLDEALAHSQPVTPEQSVPGF